MAATSIGSGQLVVRPFTSTTILIRKVLPSPPPPGAVVQAFTEPAPGEAVYVKHVKCNFIGTGLEDDLRHDGIEYPILCGATANQCVETPARMAGNLGFNTLNVVDSV